MTHYFSKKQRSNPNIRKVKAYLRETNLEFFTASGIFSKDHVDKGSELLINSAIIEDNWKVLDLGCGYGPVGITIKKLYPEIQLTMTDVNERALKLAKMNLKLYKLGVVFMSRDNM